MPEEIINGRFCVPQDWEKQPHALGLIFNINSLEITEVGGNIRRICNPGVIFLVVLLRFEKMAKGYKKIVVVEAIIIVVQTGEKKHDFRMRKF